MFDDLMSFAQGIPWLFVAIGVILFIVIVALLVRARYKIAKPDEALVISGGGKGMKIYQSGGAFVGPFSRHQFFPLGVMTVRSDDQAAMSKTLVPVIVQWTAQLRADSENEAALQKAVLGFASHGTNVSQIQDSLVRTLDGEIRAVVATMTPEEVVQDKEGFSSKVTSGVTERMTELGFKLVSLNIAEVSDKGGHYANLAAADRESKRREAETLTANANQEIAVAQARADQISESAQLDKQLTVAEKARDVALRQAGFDQETAAAQGQVTVVRAQQEQAAANAQQQVAVTEAETARKKIEIEAQSQARKVEIDAQAAATVQKTNATAKAEAAAIEAKGESDAIALKTQAQAEQIRQQGQAEADAAKARGEAEGAAILAVGQAEAERERLMADALAANEGANMQLRLAEIESTMRVTIATKSAEAVGSIGEKVTIVDMGAGSREGGGGVLTNLLKDLPGLMQQGDLQSQLLGGAPLGAMIGSLVAGLRGDQQGAGMPLGLRPQPHQSAGSEADAAKAPAEVAKPEVPVGDVVAEPGSSALSTDDAKPGKRSRE